MFVAASTVQFFANLMSTNLFQAALAEKMNMDLLEWIGKYGAKFRQIYESNPALKDGVDRNWRDVGLMDRFEMELGR